jgi:hypothetical protein
LSVAEIAPPGNHVYEVPPEATSVTDEPGQMVDEAGVTLSVGSGFTITLNVVDLTHPKVFEPETEYIVVAVGVTTTLLPTMVPGIHVYEELAPLAVSVAV